MEKLLQLYEQLKQRIGVVIVGPSGNYLNIYSYTIYIISHKIINFKSLGSGKSTLWRLLKRAFDIENNPVRLFCFNPKALDRTKVDTELSLLRSILNTGYLVARKYGC